MFSLEQYRAFRQGAALLDRSGRSRLRLTGADRLSYLQGLLTNDVAALTAGTGCYACLLTAQGRMIADMYLMETGDALLMDLIGELAGKVAAHLDQFVFSEDVQIADESDATSQLGVYGPGAAAVIAQVLDRSTDEPATGDEHLAPTRVLDSSMRSWQGATVVVVCRDDVGVRGFDLFVARARASELAEALRRAGAVDAATDVAEVCRVEGGVPLFHQDMDEDTIPLEAGIEDRAISLTKGCYVGQEIIIRVLHRGHGRVAKRLVGLTLPTSASVPARADTLRSGDREIGSITSAVWSPALQAPIAMGYVHRDFAAPSTEISVASSNGASGAVVTPLPFVDPAAVGESATPAASRS
jgi:folate-binding protein YgfZ